MKVISHNINGLKAYMKSDRCRILDEHAEIYCFQEVKCFSEEKIISCFGEEVLNNYNHYNAISTFKKGYAGVTTLIRKDIPVLYSEAPTIDIEGISGYAEGRIITTVLPDFTLINVYSVNSSGPKERDRILYEMFLQDYINKIRVRFSKPIILCGDLNVCSTELDYWGKYDAARNTCAGLMDFEIKAFHLLTKECNLVDAFRHFYGNQRTYSWYGSGRNRLPQEPWELGRGWRLDYFLVDASIIQFIKRTSIYELYQHYDHSPISLEF